MGCGQKPQGQKRRKAVKGGQGPPTMHWRPPDNPLMRGKEPGRGATEKRVPRENESEGPSLGEAIRVRTDRLMDRPRGERGRKTKGKVGAGMEREAGK